MVVLPAGSFMMGSNEQASPANGRPYRVLRGGAWNGGGENVRSASRFELTIMGLAIDDQRDDRPLRMPRFEGAYLLVDVMALRRRQESPCGKPRGKTPPTPSSPHL